MKAPAAFDPLAALRALERHGVRYVMIGGLGARLHGSPSVTNDLDICHARDRANLEALARTLRELAATLRGAPEGIPFQLDAKTLEMGDHFTFATTAGSLDCLGTPAGVDGFDELRRGATVYRIEDLEVPVASVEDLIRMKRAAGRPKDLIEVEVLSALLDERDGR
jgi:hypothetical protein